LKSLTTIIKNTAVIANDSEAISSGKVGCRLYRRRLLQVAFALSLLNLRNDGLEGTNAPVFAALRNDAALFSTHRKEVKDNVPEGLHQKGVDQ
jgi:hypothetical protein